MRQLISTLLLVGVLAASGWGWWNHRAQAGGPTDVAEYRYSDARLEAAADRLEQMHAYLGTYTGIDRDLFVGMTIASATEDAYCVQLMREGAWYHRKGPRGTTARGACPTA